MRLTSIAFWLSTIAFAFGGESDGRIARSIRSSKDTVISVLVSTNSSVDAARNAVVLLKGHYLAPELLLRIANGSSYPFETRRACALEFFRRHVPTETRLLELRNFVRQHQWLRREDIKDANTVTGALPINTYLGDSVFYIDILPHLSGRPSLVYFRVLGSVDVETVAEQLVGTNSIHSVEKLRVSGVVPWPE